MQTFSSSLFSINFLDKIRNCNKIKVKHPQRSLSILTAKLRLEGRAFNSEYIDSILAFPGLKQEVVQPSQSVGSPTVLRPKQAVIGTL